MKTSNFAFYLDKPFNPYVNPGGLMSASLLIQKIQPELDDLARKYEVLA